MTSNHKVRSQYRVKRDRAEQFPHGYCFVRWRYNNSIVPDSNATKAHAQADCGTQLVAHYLKSKSMMFPMYFICGTDLASHTRYRTFQISSITRHSVICME